MNTTNMSIRTRLAEAISSITSHNDVEPIISVAGEAVDALHDIDAIAEHRFGCGGNDIDADTCIKCRVTRALA